jgi:hypothetical protein
LADIWQELGVAPTTDAKAIRRAYAVRLRAMDVDREPEAFQKLRAAYETALRRSTARPTAPKKPPDTAWSSEPPSNIIQVSEPAEAPPPPSPPFELPSNIAEANELPDRPQPQPPPPEPPTDTVKASEPAEAPHPPPPPAPPTEDMERAQLQRDVNAALRAKDFAAALKLVLGGLARGTLSLGAREPALEYVMPGVVGDTSIYAEEYVSLLRLSGWSVVPGVHERISPTRQQAMARGEAEGWFLKLCQAARQGEGRAARLLLRGMPVLFVTPTSIAELQHELVRYRHYSAWIAHRFDQRNIARAGHVVSAGKLLLRFFRTFAISGYIVVGLSFVGAAFAFPPALLGTALCFRAAFRMIRPRRQRG